MVGISSAKPRWLNKKVDLSRCRDIKKMLRGLSLNTVCEEAMCPNISECFNCKVATVMILGRACTRKCKFCAVNQEKPLPADSDEPLRVKAAVEKLGLRYVVVTSPTRDDLVDGGLDQFISTITAIKSLSSAPTVEVLVPDFLGRSVLWKKLAQTPVDVISHNIETVPSLYKTVRDGADYRRSLDLLKTVKQTKGNIVTKSGIMLGLGEKESEVIVVLKDLRTVGCDALTVGQYLAPSRRHYPLQAYITPGQFKFWENTAYDLGFKQVKSGPYVRSSYLAEYPR